MAVLVPPLTENETFFRACFSPKARETLLIARSPRRAGRSVPDFAPLRRRQNRAQAHVGSAGLRHHVAHEAQQDDRERSEAPRYLLKAVKSPRVMLPRITKRPPSSRMMMVARLTASVMAGIMADMTRRMAEADFPGLGVRRREFLMLRSCCELRMRMRVAPRMLSLMTRFSQSMASWPRLNRMRILRSAKIKRAADYGHHTQDTEPQPPVDGEQHHARADDQEERGNDGRRRLARRTA